MNAHIGRLFLAAGTAATLIAMPLASRAATLSTPTIIVSEIGWAGSSLSTVDEWFELTNLTDNAIDLSGWTVTGAASSNGSITIPAGKSIPPHSTFLISNYDEANPKSSLARAPDYVTTAVSLSNAALALNLVDANGTVRDAVGSGGAPLAGRVGGGTASPGIGFASMVRLAPVADGTVAASWAAATGSDGFDQGATDLGTPGVVESWFVPTPVIASEPATEIVAVPIVAVISQLVSPPPFEEGSGVVIAPESDLGVVVTQIVENITTAAIETVPEISSEPPVIEAEPLVADMPPNTEPDVVIPTPNPITTDTTTPAVDPIPTIEEPSAIPEPIEIVADQSVETTGTASDVINTETPVENETAEIIPTAAEAIVNPATVSDDDTVDLPTTEDAVFVPVVEEPTVPTTPIQMVSITPIGSSFPPGTLLLNEFVSDATAEWIEILNPFNNVINLSGWTVRDATRKATALPDQLLGFGQFAIVTNPSGKLNNDGDTIELVDPIGAVVDAVTYGTDGETIPKKPNALARNADGAWIVTSVLTPDAKNRFDAEDATIPTVPTAADTVEPIAEQTAPQPEFPSPSQGEGQGEVIASSTASTATPTPTVEPIVEPAAEIPGPTTLRLYEIYPNATGDDSAEEFVAIENFGTATVDLRGWSIADASGKTFSPDNPMPIEPGATLVLSRDATKIVLNNTSDSVALSAPDGTLIDSISYDSPPIGSILRFQNSKWVWSGNVAGTKPGAISAGVVATPSAPMAPASASGGSVSHARVSGTVLVAPGVLGKQIFYVDDGDGGIQVYKNDADFPDLKEGDVVTVTGTTTESHGEERLKVGKKDSISVTGSSEPETAEPMAIADVSDTDHGKLLRVTGIVLVRSGSHATLEDHGAHIAVRVAEGTGIDATVFAKGTSVEVTGILVAASGSLTLLPRSPDDVTVTPTETTTAAAATVTTGKTAQASGDQQAAGVITAGTLLSLLALGGRKLIPAWKLYAKTRALRVAAQAAH